ncbi:unnamed protein product [Arctia plantaginis]|uniref:SEFIR domain-containing protein n=1 Tax=Arctia plantaginis TaxID=874455 RepID=A0A8S1BFZ1_ARCPL|nr:unnamed protein product [Arctia plantaginis]
MWRLVFLVFVCFLQYVAGSYQCSANRTELSCTSEMLGENSTNYDFCKIKVYPSDSQECGAMKFKSLSNNVNGNIGGVTLKPYIMSVTRDDSLVPYSVNHAVLNISFTNIKWKTMKFRFQNKYRNIKNHCRNIMIANDFTVDDKSVLYYDCYWAKTDEKDGQSHMLDFEATTEDKSINRGQYYFNIPTAEMLSPTTTEERWKPFMYVEILQDRLRVHIMPPPPQLEIRSYQLKVVTTCGKGNSCSVKSTNLPLKYRSDEVTYDYNYVGVNGSVNFIVTPLHDTCTQESDAGCQVVYSPIILISSEPPMMNICIASITALIVATLFAYYIALRLIRRYWCHDPYKQAMAMEIPTPPKILVVYSSANRLHAECVTSLINYLRSEYGFDIMFDGDICKTSHGDPYVWAEEAFRLATHVMYIVGPNVEEINFNIYDKPIINALKDVDALLLSFIKASRVSKYPKEIINVFFEHSNGRVPIETRTPSASFKLLKDWQKLISYLSKDLIPKRHIMRTERGRCFIENLTRAEKLLGANRDDVIVNCEKVKNFEKKILL